MVIAIREGSDIPIYQQIRDQIVQGISDGRLTQGEQLPTVRALAEEIGINSMTVNKAYQLLKQQGYIIADRRSGARVCKNFAKAPGLSFESRELLCRLAAEAKVGGMTLEEFLNECRKCYGGSKNPAGAFAEAESTVEMKRAGKMERAGETEKAEQTKKAEKPERQMKAEDPESMENEGKNNQKGRNAYAT